MSYYKPSEKVIIDLDRYNELLKAESDLVSILSGHEMSDERYLELKAINERLFEAIKYSENRIGSYLHYKRKLVNFIFGSDSQLKNLRYYLTTLINNQNNPK